LKNDLTVGRTIFLFSVNNRLIFENTQPEINKNFLTNIGKRFCQQNKTVERLNKNVFKSFNLKYKHVIFVRPTGEKFDQVDLVGLVMEKT